MPDFLAIMTMSSRARCNAARAIEPAAAMRRRALDSPPAPPLRPSDFLLFAEVKRASPSAGALSNDKNPIAFVTAQASRYADAGASVISVLTEPTHFGGELTHLAAVAGAVKTPVMRKDFLVDPYQLLEARVAGASGALLIVRMLESDPLIEMLDLAAELGLFVLLEAFDQTDLLRAAAIIAGRRDRFPIGGLTLLVGVNTRDLDTLDVSPWRLESLIQHCPPQFPRIAESGMDTPASVAKAARVGYDGALVGSALMRAADPGLLCREMIAAGAGAIRRREEGSR